MSIFNISISPINSIRVSPPVSSTIEIENSQQLSNKIINTGNLIGSYQNKSTYINHDALVLRSQLLSKNMRENHFNFHTAKFDLAASSGCSQFRALISFPSITGDDWISNENSIISDTVYTEVSTPTPVPGFPVDVILSNFTGLAENCSNYDGTYIVYNQSDYNYPVDPPNNYATDASVDVGYYPHNGNIYICLNITTPEGSSQLCQQYDIDWNTGNYAIHFGGAFPSTPWCIGNIVLNINT